MTIVDYLKMGGSLKLNYKGGSNDIEKDLLCWYGTIELTMSSGQAFFQGIRSMNYHKNITDPEQALYIFMKEYKSPTNIAYVLNRLDTKGLDEGDYEHPTQEFIEAIKKEKLKITQENLIEFNRPEWTTEPKDPSNEEVIAAFESVKCESLDDIVKYIDVIDSLNKKYTHCEFPTHISDCEGHGYNASIDWEEGRDRFGYQNKAHSIETCKRMIEMLKEKKRTSFGIISGFRTNRKSWDIIVSKIVKI